jgi:Calx-beta domain
MRFWKRRGGFDLESDLRAIRREPRPEFLHALSARVSEQSGRGRSGSLRVAFAGGLTVLLLVAVASVGGLGYAASGASHAFKSVKQMAAKGGTTAASSPSADQYKPGKGCGDRNHLHDKRYQCKMSINDVNKKEGNSGTTAYVFTVSLSDTPVSPVTVAYTVVAGTATAGLDYIPTSGTLSFPTGTRTQTITVSVIGDTIKEPNETFFVNLYDPSANALIVDSQGVGTIANDD